MTLNDWINWIAVKVLHCLGYRNTYNIIARIRLDLVALLKANNAVDETLLLTNIIFLNHTKGIILLCMYIISLLPIIPNAQIPKSALN